VEQGILKVEYELPVQICPNTSGGAPLVGDPIGAAALANDLAVEMGFGND
jgi:hypothetical protein